MDLARSSLTFLHPQRDISRDNQDTLGAQAPESSFTTLPPRSHLTMAMKFRFIRAPLLALALLLATVQQPQYALGADSSSSGASTSGNATVGSAAAADDLIGWFNCSAVTFKDQQNIADSFLEYGGFDPSAYGSISSNPYDKDAIAVSQAAKNAQCAQYQAPLCHAGICEDAQGRTVDVFVKRVLALKDPASKPNVWFFQGGPGYASPTMEYGMRALYVELKGLVNVYTMDHRGTGRSNTLDCVAAQATTSGSPSGGDIDLTEAAKCAQELQTKYGDMAAFSVTSAATDIQSFIKQYQSGSKTFVYGVSYGTALVERLMHLDTEEIVGYVLDGVSTTSGADVKDGMYMSNWDTNFDEVASHYFDLLTKDTAPGVIKKFGSKSVGSVLKNVLSDMDKNPNSKCTKWMTSLFVSPSSTTSSSTPASYFVRQLLGKLFTITITRSFIPAVVHRLDRCNKDDRLVLANLFEAMNEQLSKPSEEDALVSQLEYYLIVFSEMWESPTPDMATMLARFTSAKVSSGPIAAYLPLYCAFTKDTSAACTSLVNATTSLGSGSALTYRKDKYWNVAAKIPTQASVLILSGKLDPQTPHKYAERLLSALDGSKKELIAFEYTPHGALFNALYGGYTDAYGVGSSSNYCAVELIASYVNGAGDLTKLDKTCVGYTNRMMSNLDANPAYGYTFFGTINDMYDDELYNYYSTGLKTPLTIVSVVGGILALSLGIYLYKRLKARRARAATEAAAQVAQAGAVVQGSPTNETSFVPADSRV